MRNQLAREKHRKWLVSIGVKLDSKGKVINNFEGFPFPDYSVRNSIPTSDRIPGACVKRTMMKAKLPAGKTIGIAYNKGNYQIVDESDIKTMGKKI
tara:strand:+ start:464 stop:751 length:288 start_codon:yes stop_codon:yes gene_type:complete